MSAGTCPNELVWARHLGRDLGWLAARRLRRHLAACAPCREREAELQAERAAFAAAPERRGELAVLRARAGAAAPPTARRRGVLVGWSAAVAVAAAAMAVALRPAPSGPVLLAKGRDLFTVLVATSSGAAPLGARCAPGDRLMARYATDHAYLLVLERDGAGAVQVLDPQDGAASARLPASQGTTPTSWVLDAVPGRECFVAFFSDQPVDAARAREALARAPDAPALPGAVARVQCCEKGAR